MGKIAQSSNGVKVSIGNHKNGTDTMIINITSARDCPSLKLGLCQLGKKIRKKLHKCYARKAERQYPQVLPYRRCQARIWDKLSAAEIAAGLVEIAQRRRKTPIKYLRFSESGDFRNQADVAKLADIATVLSHANITVYGYTARRDLHFKQLPKNLVIQGSGFMVHNQFTAVNTIDKRRAVCAGDCRICGLCKARSGRKIQVQLH